MEMTRQIRIYSIFFIFCNYLSVIKATGGFYPSDYELYGPTLAANDQMIVAIQNRTGVTFSAVFNYLGSSPQFCSVSYTPMNYSEPFATMLAVGRNGLAPNNNGQFVFIVYSIANLTTYLYIASINFTLCQLTILNETNMFNTSYPQYSVLGVNANGTLAIYLSDQDIFIQSLIPPYDASEWLPIQISPTTLQLLPVGMDLKDTWGILGTYMRQSTSSAAFKPYAYLISFTNCFTSLNSSCFQFQRSSLMNYYASWQTQLAPPSNAATNGYNSFYAMSVSISNLNSVLIGVQSMNSVFSFSASSTSLTARGYRFLNSVPSVGFGKAVGWLDSTSGAILLNNFTIDYVQWRSSNIQLYSLTTTNLLSNTLPVYASFPSASQQLWSQLNTRLINMIANPDSGSLIFMDYVGQVQVIRPSSAGYFVYVQNGFGAVNNTIYIAPTVRCPSGTIKNITAHGKDIFRYCVLCPEGSYYSLNNSNNQSNQCTPCNATTDYCPWGSVTALPISVLSTQSQTQVYPESPENDDFEDILLINMFNFDFPTYCLAKQPLFYAIVIIGIGCLVLLFMGILKLTGKCKKQRRMIKRIFKQTDLIGEGELWIGGVASFAIIVIAVFSYRFSSAFINEYPIETAPDATFACDPTLRNAKFATSMQSLGTPVLEEEQPIFDMLDNQPFTLNVAFINTDFSSNSLTVSQVLGAILLNLPRTTQATNGILQASTNLTSHTTTIVFNVSSNSAVGALRVGLWGPSIENGDYYVQELNFSYAFNYSNHTLTQNPIITIQLIKLINSTQALSSDNNNNTYSALWIPTFTQNNDQLFYTESDFRLYHVEDNTVLTIQITEATYYILNQQTPITRPTEVIFTDILFTTMCIELFALLFLFYKLAISPTIKAILGLCTARNKVTAKGNGISDSGCAHCPHCKSIDSETLSANIMPIQRAEQDIPTYAIRRQTSDISKLHIVSASPNMFNS